MPENKQRGRIIAAAVALTFLLGGAGAGAWGVHVWWQERVADPAFRATLNGQGPKAAAPKAVAAAPIRMATARLEVVRPEKMLVGRLREIQKTTISSEVSGKIVRMDVQEGSPVDADGTKTVLAEIDDTWLKLGKAKQQARIEVIQAQLRKEQHNLARIQDLRKRGVATEHELIDQQAAHDQKVAELKEAQVALNDLVTQYQRLKITAPFSGWVVRKHAEEGQWVNPGSPVVDIVNRGRIYAEMNVPESLVDALAPGMPIPVKIVPLDMEVHGTIAAITPYGSTASRTYPVRVLLSNKDGRLKVGMSTTAIFPAGRKQRRITVSRDAVLIKPDGSTVWVVRPGQPMTAVPVPVQIVTRVADKYAVEPVTDAGRKLLLDSAQVVIEGAERLRPNQAVRPMDPKLAEAKWLGAKPDGPATAPATTPAETGAATRPHPAR